MKKKYLKPTTVVIELQHSIMQNAIEVQRTAGSGDTGYGGSDAEVPDPILRSRQARFSDWDNGWE